MQVNSRDHLELYAKVPPHGRVVTDYDVDADDLYHTLSAPVLSKKKKGKRKRGQATF